MIRNTIYYSPFTAIYENRAPGTICCGSPGAGKTYFALQVIANTVQQEGIVIAIDPKNDIMKIRDYCKIDRQKVMSARKRYTTEKEFAEAEPDNYKMWYKLEGGDDNIFHVTDITKKQNLDPFMCVNNIDTNFIMDIINTICKELSQEQNIAVTPIVDDYIKMARKGGASFLKMADYMYAHQNPAVQQIGTVLKSCQNNEYGKVFFNTEKKGMKVNKEDNIICMMGLPIPKTTNMEDWTREGRFGSAIVMVIVKMLRELLNNYNDRPVLLVIDEAHIILENKAIYRIVEEFLILGRSLNVCTLLLSQNVHHFPEDFSNFVSNRFQFRSSKNEIEEFIRRFNEDTSISVDGFIKSALNFANGECIYIDRLNRISCIKIRDDLALTSNAIENYSKN